MKQTTGEERARVNHELKKMGFGGLEDRNLIPQIAFCMRDHDQFRGLLLSVMPAERRHAYEVLRPHLRFAAKPLDVYEAEGKRLAEEQQLPYYNPKTGELTPMGPARISQLAEDAIKQMQYETGGRRLTLTCRKCTVQQAFPAKVRKDAEKAAHAAGWRSDERHSYCPQHVPGRGSMTLECKECERVERIRCWDPQDGYASARLRGWKIDELGGQCPRCSAKLLIVQ